MMTARIDCRNCGGDGLTAAPRPNAMHTSDPNCPACKGTGKEPALTAAMTRELHAIAKTGEPTDPYDWVGAAALWFHARDRVLSALIRRGLIEATEGGFALTADGRAALKVAS